jgi:hypothetical protein
MGAWDVTAFGNDDAADWTLDLQDAAAPADFLERTLHIAKRDGYMEAPDGCQLVAAAAVVAAACGRAPAGLSPGLGEWIRGKEAVLKYVAPAALAAIQRVRSDESELRDLWQESDDFSAWSADLESISTALH